VGRGVRVIAAAVLLAAFTVAPSAQHSVAADAHGLERVLPILDEGDARAMNEMLRGTAGHERHWTQRPRLVVVTTVMAFANGSHEQEFAAVDAEVPDEDARQLVDDLTAGLTLLSGRTFEHFASVRFEHPSAGTQVRVARAGEIVVGRFRGVRAALAAVGYGGRTSRADGTITSGTVMLDEDYDSRDRLRNLLRMHELGHALGYNHVESQRSIMNPTLGVEPTDFDRKVARLAFSHLTPDTPRPLLLAIAR
jgi:hypothetical protein